MNSTKIVFFDIDGTLCDEKFQISNSTVEAIGKLKERGLEITLSTGRTYSSALMVAKELNVNSIICYNGSYVIYNGKEIHKKTINLTLLEKITAICDEFDIPISYLTLDKDYMNGNNKEFIAKLSSVTGLEAPPIKRFVWKDEALYGLRLFVSEKEQELFQELMGEIKLVKSFPYFLDVVPHDVSKAIAINILLDHLNIKKEESVAFGDGPNDVEMFSGVGLSVAMGNASEDVKRSADLVTTSIHNDGVKNALCQIGLI